MPPRDLTQGPIGRTLFVFALPILGGNVLQSMNGSVNAIWVGRFLGENALTAIANANNIMFLLLGGVFGFGMASTILVGQAMGRKDLPGARRVIGTAATFFLGISIALSALGLPLSRHVLAWMSTPAAALPLADAYLKIIFLALPFLYAFAFLSAILRGAGDTRTPFGFLLLAVAFDIVLVPVLMFGLGPFPAMAIGAACSSMAAQNVGAGLWSRVDATARSGVAFNFLLTGALIVPLLLLDRFTLSLFMPDGSASLEIARHLNHIAVWSFLFFGVVFVLAGVVRSTGAVVPPLVILAIALWGIRVPFATLLQPRLGVDAIWWSFPVSAACAMAMQLAYYHWGGWRRARMLPVDPEELATPSEVPAQAPSPVAGRCPRVGER